MSDFKVNKNKKLNEHSGFEAPIRLKFIPDNYVKKVNKDGTVSYVPPKKKKK